MVETVTVMLARGGSRSWCGSWSRDRCIAGLSFELRDATVVVVVLVDNTPVVLEVYVHYQHVGQFS